jgi:GTP-binding protein
MRFIDEAEILVQAGNGGNGCRSFLREKYRPKGGPDGGDGGKGGDVILLADSKRNTLLELHLRKHYRAEPGRQGRGKNQHGRKGKDQIIRVPVGTLIRDAEGRGILQDLSAPGQRFLAAGGGRGGRGNARFVTPVCKLPEECEEGGRGESKRLHCELKLLADVGLVGFPNAGKSTLLAKLSSAKPKIADYPFTTLVPQLGLVRADEDRSFVIADIPGILPGAAEGVGLGIRFLKHIERTSVLLFLIDLGDPVRDDPLETYQALREELARFSTELLEKHTVVAFNKTDLPLALERKPWILDHPALENCPVFFISAVTGKGLGPLTRGLFRRVQASRQEQESSPSDGARRGTV